MFKLFSRIPVVTAAGYVRRASNGGFRPAVTVFVDGKIVRTFYGSVRHASKQAAYERAYRAKYTAECMAIDVRGRIIKDRVEFVLGALGCFALAFGALSLI